MIELPPGKKTKRPKRQPIDRYPLVLPMLRTVRHDAVAEFKFCQERQWRADFALPWNRVLIEIDGGTWTGGRHTRGAGFKADQRKTNAAAVLGYRVLRFLPEDIQSGYLLTTVRQALESR